MVERKKLIIIASIVLGTLAVVAILASVLTTQLHKDDDSDSSSSGAAAPTSSFPEPSSFAAADGPKILAVESENRIPNQYIISFNVTYAENPTIQEDILSTMNTELSDTDFAIISQLESGAVVQISDDQLDRLTSLPQVRNWMLYVEADQIITLDQDEGNGNFTAQATASWGIDRVDQRNLPLDGSFTPGSTAGYGVTVYVLDTGILPTHVEFGGRATAGPSFVSGETSIDCHGHGSHCAGTIAGATVGLARRANVVGIKVFGCAGSGSVSGIVSALQYVSSNGRRPCAVSMSLGGGVSTSLDNAVATTVSAGVPVIVAAGNSAADASTSSPARAPSAFTVGATDKSDVRASFSNYGSLLDIFAPGVSIVSCGITSNTAYATMSGTSMACPHVAGTTALFLGENPSATPSAVYNGLSALSTAGKVSNPGSGSINKLLYWSPSATSTSGSVTSGSVTSGSGSITTGSSTTTTTSGTITTGSSSTTGGTGGKTYTGTISTSGSGQYVPSNYFFANGGTFKGALSGPATADFDLRLLKWGSRWDVVASSAGPTSTESVTYTGTSGYYVWMVYAYAGTGSYSLNIVTPV